MTVRGLALTTTLLGFIFLQRIGANLFNRALENEKKAASMNLVDQACCQACSCGFPNVKARIVGGWETQVNEYPWVVALYSRGRFYCGGTIINDLYILTAAHCVSDQDRRELLVVIAEHNRSSSTDTREEIRRVANIVVHEKYNKKNNDNDIALLKLYYRLQFRREVSPVCLPYPDERVTGAMAYVMGWGTTTEGGEVSPVLLETYVFVMSNSDCHRYPGYGPAHVTKNMLCAGVVGGGHDSCQGDSGGSLVIEDWRRRMFQAGVVSWGIGCGRPNNPGVYTRVNNYLRWIAQYTQDACYCT